MTSIGLPNGTVFQVVVHVRRWADKFLDAGFPDASRGKEPWGTM